MARWRLSGRLAWREVRRRPGRTSLVLLLIAIPVFGMTVGSVLARTAAAGSAWERQWGSADLVVSQSLDDPFAVAEVVPVSAAVTSGLWASVPIETNDGTVSYAELGEPGAAPLMVDTTGRAPQAADEAWVSRPLLDRLGLDVGDELVLAHPSGTWTIVGTGVASDSLESETLVVGRLDAPLQSQFRPDVVQQRTLIDLRPGATAADVAELDRSVTEGLGDASWFDRPAMWHRSDNLAEVLAWGWVIGALALAVTGIIVAAAFATSARRQLAMVGLLSSNGAPERTIRRSLMLQGSWTGAGGAALGVGAGLLVLALSPPLLEHLQGHTLSGYRIAPLDLAVIAVTGVLAASLAALVPARTASCIPVMAALAGRRPLGTVPRRLVPAGLGMFALGTLLLVVATTGDGGNAGGATAVVGGVLILAGVCCASPLAIDAMARAAAAVGRSWRFAGRSLGRTRTRSAAVVAAIAVTVAAGCVVSSAVAGIGNDDGGSRTWPADAVVAVAGPPARYVEPETPDAAFTVDYGPLVDAPVSESVQTAVVDVVPTGRWYPRRMATWDAAPESDDSPTIDATDSAITFGPGTGIIIADPATIDLYELSDDERALLAASGALLLDTWSGSWFGILDGGEVVGRVDTEHGALTFPLAVGPVRPEGSPDGPGTAVPRPVSGTDAVIITEDATRAAGFDVVTAGGFLRSDAPLTAAQERSLDGLFGGDASASLGWTYRDVPQPTEQAASTSFWYDGPRADVSGAALQGLAVAGTLVLTMLVVGIGLALAATESRDERDVLIAVGARPRTMRSLAGAKAYVLTLTGAALGVPAGLIPTFAVVRANHSDFDMPWLGVAGLVVAVPAVAGAAAWAGSSIAQRVRPVRMSTLATD